MSYFRKRLTQPSTWLGVGTAIAALVASGGALTPVVLPSLLAALGLIQIDEHPKDRDDRVG